MVEDESLCETERIVGNPNYRALVTRRTRFCAVLVAIVFSAYFGYVALIAFDKPFMARPMSGGVMSLGIPIGMAVIVLTVVCTAAYAIRANSEFDVLTQAVIDEVRP